jgi:hypothetical protein
MKWFKKLIGSIKKVGKSTYNTIKKVGKRINETISNKETITREQISKEEAEALLISRQAYRNPKLDNIGNYTLLRDISNETTVIYKNPNNEIIIGYRGSKVMKDWTSSNLSIIKHNEEENERFKTDLAFYDTIISTLKPSSVKITGHSLSGLIVLFINSQRTNKILEKSSAKEGAGGIYPPIKKVYAINPAFNLNAFNKYYKPNVLILRTLNDAVSSLASISRYPVKTIQTRYDDEAGIMKVLKSHGLGSILD